MDARLATLLLLVLGLFRPAFAAGEAPAPASRPNILWLIAEDFGVELGSYGTREVWTPNLDRLAAEGVRYTRCFTTAPVCSPSRSAFMTGMYQTTIGAHNHRSHRDDGYLLPAGARLLTDRFREAGYFTANLRVLPERLGFRGTGKTDWNFHYPGKPFDSDRWADLKAHQPFFAQINFQETHRKFHAPRRADPARVAIPPYYPDHPTTREDWAAYLDAATELDRKVGLVLDELASDGLAASTLVVFFADNGQAHVRGKQFCYDSGLHVPLIIRWPASFPPPANFRAGAVDDRLVAAIDLAPTMLALAGAAAPAGMQGEVFLGDRAAPPRQYVFGARDRCDETVFRFRTVRDARYRYIRNFTPERPFLQPNRYKETQYPVWNLLGELAAAGKLTPEQAALCAPSMPEEELYDLELDPFEIRNLARSPEHAEVRERLRAALERWIEATNDQGRELEPPGLAARKGVTRAETDPNRGYALGAEPPPPATAPPEAGVFGDRLDELHPPRVTDLAFSADSRRLAAAFFRNALNRPGTDWAAWVAVWDLGSGERLDIERACAPVRFHPDGTTLAMADYGRSRANPMAPVTRLALWRVGEKEPYRVLARGGDEDDSVAAAAFAYGGRKIVSLTFKGEVILHELADDAPPVVLGRIAAPLFRGGTGRPSISFSDTGTGTILAVSPRTRRLGGNDTGADLPSVAIWRATDGERRSFERVLAWSPEDGSAAPFDLPWHLAPGPLTLPRTWMPRVPQALPRDSSAPELYERVAAGHFEGGLVISSGEPGVTALVGRPGAPGPLLLPFPGGVAAFRGDGKKIAGAGPPGSVRIWDVNAGRIERTLRLDERPPETFLAAAIQARSAHGDVKGNRERLADWARQAAARGAELIVLPEAAVTGYASEDLRRVWRLEGRPLPEGREGVDPAAAAEAVPGASTDFFGRLARELAVYIAVPLVEADPGSGRYFNTVVVMDPFGALRLHYRRRSPGAWAETGWASAGNLGNPVLDTPFGRLGILIGQASEEEARLLAELEVDLVLVAAAWVDEEGRQPFPEAMRALAKRHGFQVVAANWTVGPGEPSAWRGHGKSIVVDRQGNTVALAGDDRKEAIVLAPLPLPGR